MGEQETSFKVSLRSWPNVLNLGSSAPSSVLGTPGHAAPLGMDSPTFIEHSRRRVKTEECSGFSCFIH